MSIAVATTPKVLVTASPTFLARVPPSSSSGSASSSSAQRKHLRSAKRHSEDDGNEQNPIDMPESGAHTRVRRSLFEAAVADPDGGEAPAPLGDGRRFGRAAVAEALSAGTAVMLGVVVLEDRVTLMAHLVEGEKNTITTAAFIDRGLQGSGRARSPSDFFFYLLTRSPCVIGKDPHRQ